MPMNDETKRLQDRYDQDEIMGYICMDCWNDNYYAEKKRTVIVQFGYRVSHLVKKHGYKKSKLPKEYSLDESEDYGTRFSLKLKTNIVCPHCDEVLDRSVRILSSDFEHYHCFNKQCPYEKKHNHFYFNY